jgi:hypothetical protein
VGEHLCAGELAYSCQMCSLITWQHEICRAAIEQLIRRAHGDRKTLVTAQFCRLSPVNIGFICACIRDMHRLFADLRQISCKISGCMDCASNGSCRGHGSPSQAHAASRGSEQCRRSIWSPLSTLLRHKCHISNSPVTITGGIVRPHKGSANAHPSLAHVKVETFVLHFPH